MTSRASSASSPAPHGVPPLDLQAVRSHFPILERQVRGRPLVYLDSAATSQTPTCVLEALQAHYRQHRANVHRGVYALAEEATADFEAARARVARFVDAPGAGSVVFTRGTTEAINLVAGSWGATHLRPGDEVLLTVMEHHSNLVPWQLLARQRGLTLRFLPVTDDGELDLPALEGLLGTGRTRLVALVHKSNVLGTVNPVAEVAARAHAAGALVLVDAAQSVAHRRVSFRELGADFLAFSGHKMCGPTGIGALVARPDLLEAMPPWQAGGEMIRRVTLEETTWNDPPHRFEAGTPDVAGAIGLAAAMDFLEAVGLEAIEAHEVALTRRCLEGLAALDWITTYGPPSAAHRPGVVTFNDREVHPHDLATLLDREGIAVRGGHHCAQPLMDRFGMVASTRASFYLYTTHEEVEALLEGLRRAHAFFGHDH